ncbi:four helix bundle protein [Phormidesmis sp. 146-33]
MRIAIASVSELDTQLEICRRLGYLSDQDYLRLDEALSNMDKMLIGLRKSLIQKQTRPPL